MKGKKSILILVILSFCLIFSNLPVYEKNNGEITTPSSSSVIIDGVTYTSNHSAIAITTVGQLDDYFAGNPEGMNGNETNPYIFENMAIDNQIAIRLESIGGKYVIIRNCVLFGEKLEAFGVLLISSHQVTIENNIIFNQKVGIKQISGQVMIRNNTIIQSIGDGDAYGILLDSTYNNIVQFNELRNCETGIKISNVLDSEVTDNKIIDCIRIGIEFFHIPDINARFNLKIQRNYISNCGQYGVAVLFSLPYLGVIDISNNTISKCDSGIFTQGFSNIFGNTISDCLDYGIEMKEFNNVTNNSILNCKSGIRATSGSYNNILNNSIMQSTDKAMYLINNNTIGNNIIIAEGGSGIYGNDNNTVFNNSISKCTSYGIKVAHNNNVSENEINSCRIGIRAEFLNKIYGNSIFNALESGIQLIDSNNSIYNNFIDETNYGISIMDNYDCSNNSIDNNTILNSNYGIVIGADSVSTSIQNNSISSCDYGIKTSSRAYNCQIENNSISQIQYDAITLFGSESYTVNNTIQTCENGIIISSNYNFIVNNSIWDADSQAIYILSGIDNILINNSIGTNNLLQNLAPVISTIFNAIWIETSTLFYINWTVTDDSLFQDSRNYTIKIDNIINRTGSWISNDTIEAFVFQPIIGIFRYELEITDGYVNVTNIVNVVVHHGPDGIDGINGIDGIDGIDGINGTDSIDGIDGINGTDGIDGVDGINGTDSIDGLNGINGTDGVDGINGTDGTDGYDGQDGVDGNDGIDGLDGNDGNDGIYLNSPVAIGSILSLSLLIGACISLIPQITKIVNKRISGSKKRLDLGDI